MYVDYRYNKIDACYTVKIFKNKPLKNFKQGGMSPVCRRWIHLWSFVCLEFLYHRLTAISSVLMTRCARELTGLFLCCLINTHIQWWIHSVGNLSLPVTVWWLIVLNTIRDGWWWIYKGGGWSVYSVFYTTPGFTVLRLPLVDNQGNVVSVACKRKRAVIVLQFQGSNGWFKKDTL